MLTVRQPNGFLSYAWMETNPLAEEAARVVQTLAAYHAGEDIDDPLTEQIDDDTFDEMVDALLAHQREYTTVEIEVVFTEQ